MGFPWYFYAAVAAICLGSFGIPLKFTNDKLSPFAVNILYGIMLIIVNLKLHYNVKNQQGYEYEWNFDLKQEWCFALLAVSIQVVGVTMLIYGLLQQDVIYSQYFAIVSSQTLFSTYLGLLILGETQFVVLWRIIIGSAAIFGGSLLMIL